jgi:hypothetical protein
MEFHEFGINSKQGDSLGDLFFKELKKYNFENLVVPVQHIQSIYNKVNNLAKKQGWISNWSHSTPAEVEDLLKEWSNAQLSDEDQKQLISKFFIDYYSGYNFRRLEEFIIDWTQNPLFQKRIKIFQDCLWILKNPSENFNPSNLIVPVLFTQIEGVMSDYLEREGWIYCDIITQKGKTKKMWIKRTKLDSQDKYDSNIKCFGNITKGKKIDFLREIQIESHYDLITEGLFHTANRGVKLPEQISFNRHKILHGEETEYGNLTNTLKLFLILDYLSRFKISNLVDPL